MIHIIGAGISGLSLGYYLKKHGHEIRIYEASNKAGGLISTEFYPEGMVQHGPHLVRMNDTLKVLFQELNIKTTTAINTRRYIAQNSFIFNFPLTLSETLKAILLQFRAKKSSYSSLADFTNHHYGTAITEKLVQPLTNGVYATFVKELDHEIAFPNLYFTEKRAVYHTLKVLLQKLYFKKQEISVPTIGFQALIDALAAHLADDISYNTKIEDISDLDGKIFITIPAFQAKSLRGLSHNTAQYLKVIDYSSLDITTVFSQNAIQKEGIGFLSTATNGVLGVLFNSSAFENRVQNNLHSYSVFSKNMQQHQVENFLQNTFKIKLQKSYFKSYTNAIPIYNNAVKNFINYNNTLKVKYHFFSNYTGACAVGKIIEEAKKLSKSNIFS